MNKLRELFSIDLRSLALFRICIALIILFHLTTIFPDLGAFYTDLGVLPRASLFARLPSPWTLSIHFMNGTFTVQAILIFLQALCALGLLLGYRTRWMSVLSWFLMASLHRRNPMVIGGGDDYFRLLLFWGMFLPLGARYSLDSLLGPARPERPERALSWGTAAILLQVAGGYLMAVYHKWDLPVWQNGTAVYYALNVDNYAKSFAQTLLHFPFLLKLLTHGTLWFELLAPLLMFCPVFTGPIRVWVISGFLLMHLGFYLSMHLMLFPWVSAAAVLVFLPSWFWDRRGTQPSNFIEIRSSKTGNACALLFLICVLSLNLEAMKPLKFKMPEPIRALSNLVHLNQAWRMFAPPAPTGGWFVIPGRLKDGTQVDLFRQGEPVVWTRPPSKAWFENERWRRYMFNYVFGKNKTFWPDYARYLCRTWNAAHTGQKRVESLEIVFMARKTPAPGQTADYVKKILLKQSCDETSKRTPIQEDGSARPPAFAGKFYPSDAAALSRIVDSFVANAPSAALSGKLVAMMFPHAAYRYSGAVASYGYRQIDKDWSTVILLGPSHRVPVQGAAVWARGSFWTPLGPVAVDEALAKRLLGSSDLMKDLAVPHEKEHSLEVQLPFLQRTLGNFKIVPILLSTTDLSVCRQIGEAIARTIKGQKVLILISSDLSHYPDQETARQVDDVTLKAIEQRDPELVRRTAQELMERGTDSLKTTMCGQGALQAGLYAAQALGADHTDLLRYANSGDSEGGDPKRVVGYAAIAFTRTGGDIPKEANLVFNPDDSRYLLTQASQSIQEGLDGKPEYSPVSSNHPIFDQRAGVFVTVYTNGQLRGCRGSTSPSRSLLEQVKHFARMAAFDDPRFPPITKEEFKTVTIKISILSAPEQVDSVNEIVPGKHGVVVKKDGRTGLFLPSVWEKIPEKERFLMELCTQKAKLSANCWNDPQITLSVFTTTDLTA